MSDVFPEPIQKLPLADIPFDGITAYLSQADNLLEELGIE
jgi:hypothetical protein